MAWYLVAASPKRERLDELRERLGKDEFRRLRPFGNALTASLRNARLRSDGVAVWEEEDYCSPPLAEERAAVLDAYFDGLGVEPVLHREGWRRIAALPPLFPEFSDSQETRHG